MSAATIVLPLTVLVLVCVSALLSMVETAFSSLTETTRQIARQRSKAIAERLEKLMRARKEVLTALTIADNLVNLPLIFLCLWWIDLWSFWVPTPLWVETFLLFSALILFCELLPKLIGLTRPLPILLSFWPLLCAIHRTFAPLTEQLLTWNDQWIVQLQRHHPFPVGKPSLEELLTLIEIAGEEKGLRKEEKSLLQETIKLSDEPATHCMTPRVDAFILPDDLTNAEAATLLRAKRHRRVPIRGETPDEILGILDTQEFLLSPRGHYTEMLKTPSFLPETMHSVDLLLAFQTHRQSMAILLDEYGGMEGVVTLADLLEEILREESTRPQLTLDTTPMEDRSVLVSGGEHLDNLSEMLGLDTTRYTAHTIGGLLIEHFGQLPKPGASLLLGKWNVQVRRISRKRILEVLISPAPLESPPCL